MFDINTYTDSNGVHTLHKVTHKKTGDIVYFTLIDDVTTVRIIVTHHLGGLTTHSVTHTKYFYDGYTVTFYQ